MFNFNLKNPTNMKNRKLIIYNFLLAVLIIAVGCEETDFFSKPPELEYTRDSVFASADRAREALWNAYATLPQGVADTRGNAPGTRGGVGVETLWSLTDLTAAGNTWGTLYNLWITGNLTAVDANGTNTIYDFYTELGWDGIRDSYIFIDNVDRVPDMGEAEKTLLKAEAKMIIATHYVHMFRAYGGILYVDHAYSPNEDMHVERLTVLQSVDTINSMIDEAMPHLPFELEDPETWSGRFTSAGAMALRVKLLEFAAAPLLNSDEPYMPESHEAVEKRLVWTGGYQRELWEDLRDACKELIDKIEASSYYGMVNTGNPGEDYTNGYWTRGTGETLLSFREIYETGWEAGGPNWGVDQPITVWWTAFRVPLHNYVMKFPMQNGMSIDNPASGYDPQNPYANRDPRLYETIKVNGGSNRGRKAELWVGGRDRSDLRFRRAFTGYKLRKWVGDGNRPTGMIMHWPYFRIPELYLAYAEALNELNDGPTDEAFEYANKTRERVNVGSIEDFIGKPRSEITKEEFLDALLNERALELGCENVRWYDIVRYKITEVFQKRNLTMDIYLTEEAEAISNFSEVFQNEIDFSEHSQYFRYEIGETTMGALQAWQNDFSPKWYLMPYPYDEIQKDYGLVQNPGWELN